MIGREKTTAAPIPPLPPKWLALAEVSTWVHRMYGISGDVISKEIGLAAKRGLKVSGGMTAGHKLELMHRISGIYSIFYSINHPAALPPGLGYAQWSGGLIYVTDWDAAEVDWSRGTVGGWVLKPGGSRERLPIEISWTSVERFVRIRLPEWKLEMADRPTSQNQSTVSADSPKKKLLPPFDAKTAKALLAAKKIGGGWSDPPTEAESRAFLLQNFNGVSNEPHRRIRKELWPSNRRGPRRKPKQSTAK